jgi:hypothetical protein
VDNTLQHVGVIGMHWGVHRGNPITTTSVRGKETPMFKSVHGKPVQVDARGKKVTPQQIEEIKAKANAKLHEVPVMKQTYYQMQKEKQAKREVIRKRVALITAGAIGAWIVADAAMPFAKAALGAAVKNHAAAREASHFGETVFKAGTVIVDTHFK